MIVRLAGSRGSIALHLAIAFSLATVAAARAEDPPAEPPPVRWYKGNLHTHSLWSDGNDFPEMIVDWYKRRGYHFLALSDHNILSEGEKWIPASKAATRGAIGGLARYQERFGSEWVETRGSGDELEVRLRPLDEFRPLFEEPDRFLLIQGEEITDHFEDLPVHINASNLEELIRPQGGEGIRETIANNLRAVAEQEARLGRPILAHLNHPNFGYAITAEDMAAVLEERFFEVYNGHDGVHQPGDEEHAPVERMWDIANTIRITELGAPPLFGLATDDSHNYFGDRGASPGRGWVMVRSSDLSPTSIVEAIERGEFYASSGVALVDVGYSSDEGVLTIEAEAADGESLTIDFIGTRQGFDPSHEPVVDAQGRPVRATERYSPEIGEVLATAEGPTARYKLQGDELYVRAVVTSSSPHENPSFEGQRKQAWTQPVGYEKWLEAPATRDRPTE